MQHFSHIVLSQTDSTVVAYEASAAAGASLCDDGAGSQLVVQADPKTRYVTVRREHESAAILWLPPELVMEGADAMLGYFWRATGESPLSSMPHVSRLERVARWPRATHPDVTAASVRGRGKLWTLTCQKIDGGSVAVAVESEDPEEGESVTDGPLTLPLRALPAFADALLYTAHIADTTSGGDA